MPGPGTGPRPGGWETLLYALHPNTTWWEVQLWGSSSCLPLTFFCLMPIFFLSTLRSKIFSLILFFLYERPSFTPIQNNRYNFNNKLCSIIKVGGCRLLRNLGDSTKPYGVTFQWTVIVQYALQSTIPGDLRRGSAAARLLGLRVRMPPGA